MATLASQAQPEINSCTEVLNLGTSAYLILLDNCAKEPPLVTLTVDAAALQGDQTISLTSDADVTLREGAILTFNNDPTLIAEVTAKTTVTSTATSVPVNALPTALAGTETAPTLGLNEVLSPTNIPFPVENTMVNRTDLKTFFDSQSKTKMAFNPQIAAITVADDDALFDALEGSISVQDVFAVLKYSDNTLAFGRAIVSNYNKDGNIEEIGRPTFTLNFQGGQSGDSALFSAYYRQSTAKQAIMNTLAERANFARYDTA